MAILYQKDGKYYTEDEAKQLFPEKFSASTSRATTAPAQTKSGGGISSYFPGAQIGKSITQGLGNLQNLASGGKAKFYSGLAGNEEAGGRVDVPATIGDYLQAGATVVPGLGQGGKVATTVSKFTKATNIGKNIAANTATGYAYDVGANLKEGKRGTEIAKPGVATAIGAVATPFAGALGTIGRAAENKTAQKIASGAGQQPGMLKRFISGRTPEQVLATPRNQLHKLSSSERNLFFQEARSKVEKEAGEAATKASISMERQFANLEKQTEELSRKLQIASRDEVLKLRPKIREAMGRQSAKYRQIVSEELIDKKDLVVDEPAFANFVRTRFAENPAQAETILSKLGVDAARTEGSSTIGKIVDQMRLLRKEIGTSAKSGVRSYTADEKLTDDAVSTLSSFLKENGVDLAEANKFWARYAPIRNQLIREAKPFLQSDTQTKTFASTINRVLKGDDVNNENFIKEVEKLVQQPIGKDIRGILSQLDMTQKKTLAQKAIADGQKMEAKLLKEAKLKKLTNEQFEAERKSGWRRIFRQALIIVAGTGISMGVGGIVYGSQSN